MTKQISYKKARQIVMNRFPKGDHTYYGEIPLFGVYHDGKWLAIECRIGIYKDGITLVDIDSKEKLH